MYWSSDVCSSDRWLDRGVDCFRLDAINFAMCDPALRDNPPAPDDGHVRTRPFDFQRHLHNQSQPAIADFLARLRAVCDSYGERFTLAAVGGAREIGRAPWRDMV